MGNKKKREQKNKPLLAFAMTFSGILLTGLLVILAVKISGMGRGAVFGAFSQNTADIKKETADKKGAAGGFAGKKADNGSAKKHTTLLIHKQETEREPAQEKEVNELPSVNRFGDLLEDADYLRENRIYIKEADTEGMVSIGFAGDILFDDEYAIMTRMGNGREAIENGLSAELLAEMRAVDIMMLNNEFPYTLRGEPLPDKTYTFRADPFTSHYLEDMGVDIVSLANNHIYDYGETGVYDTFETLESAGMPYVGGGRNIEEASAPVYFIVGDIKIGIISATQIERLDNPDTRGATEKSPGTFRCFHPARLYETVEQTKEKCDFCIVYIHWGTENVEEPDWAQLDQASALAGAGADLIIGDHPHCLQGIQYYGDVPAFYSLGNFWFNSKQMDSCLVRVDISKDGIEQLHFLPAIQSDMRTRLAEGEEKVRIIQYMNTLSGNAVIDGNGLVTKR